MELLERDKCLTDLSLWLSAATAGPGRIALIAGEAGIGKTALLQAFAAAQREARVLWGACDALFTPRPLAPLHDIARQTQGPLLAAISAGKHRNDIFAAALDELEQTKTLVVFEDMHWADEATLDLLKYLGRRIQRTRALLLVSYRDDEVGPRHPLRFVIGDLPRAGTSRMNVPPLTESAVALLTSRAGRPWQNLHLLTGGNAFFVTEALASEADSVPASLRDAVLARAMRLTPAARDVAELTSVVPGTTEPWLLSAVVSAGDSAVEDCLGVGMVRSDDGSLSFRHELARRAFEDSVPVQRKQRLHAGVFAVLATRVDISAARLAHHAAAAQDSAGVLRFAPLAAAQAAAVGAHREAASHYQAAVRHAASLSPDEQAMLCENLAYEYFLTGQHDAAIAARQTALGIWRQLGSRTREGDTLQWLSRLSWFSGNRKAAREFGEAAVATLETLPPSLELARAYSACAQLDMELHEEASATRWAERAMALAQALSDNATLSDALDVLGTVHLIGGDASGESELQRALQLALAGGLQEQIASAYNSLAAMAVSRRDYPAASRYLSEGLAYCEERDLDSWRLYMLAYRARKGFEQGDWQGASDDAEAVLRHPLSTPITRIPALRTLGHVRVRRGDPDAETLLNEAWALGGESQELQRVGTLAAIRADAAWLDGDHEAVLRHVAAVWPLLRQRRDPRMKGELAAWLWRVGALRESPSDIAEPYAREITGDWRGAADLWKSLGCPYEFASLLAWHGDEPDQREALGVLEQLGAAPAVQALRRTMRLQGVRAIPRGQRASTRSNPLGLTRRESEILALLSEGLRNAAIAKRLFVATKTVDHHVSAILAKLGVQTRAQAVAVARNLAAPSA